MSTEFNPEHKLPEIENPSHIDDVDMRSGASSTPGAALAQEELEYLLSAPQSPEGQDDREELLG